MKKSDVKLATNWGPIHNWRPIHTEHSQLHVPVPSSLFFTCKTHETHCLCCMHAACNDLLRTSSSQILGIRLMAPYRTPWSIIDSHCKSRHHNKAEELFEAMQNSGCSPFTTTYDIMINSFGEQERWEDVKTLLGKM